MPPAPQTHKRLFLLKFAAGIFFLALLAFQSGLPAPPWLKIFAFVSMLSVSMINFWAAWVNFEHWLLALQQSSKTETTPPADNSIDTLKTRLDRLNQLLKAGAISDLEHNRMRDEILTKV